VRITKVEIFPVGDIAMVKVILDDCFALTGIKIEQGEFGFRIKFPGKQGRDRFYNSHIPITKDCRDYFTDTILEEWYKLGG